MARRLDHIVYCVPDLEQACLLFSKRLGVTPIVAGKHPAKGTKNALLSLGDGAYFELLAVDDSNRSVPAPRWMGIDLISQPQVTRWSVKSNDLDADAATLRAHNYKLGPITQGKRDTSDGSTLTWQLIEPLPHPLVDIVPFFLDWSASTEHPSKTIRPTCQLIDFRLAHVSPKSLLTLFDGLGIENSIEKSSEPKISVLLEGPAGRLLLE